MFSARVDKQGEKDQVLDDVDLYDNLTIIKKFRESDSDIIYVRSQLEQQIQNKQTNESGWRLDKTT